MKLIKKPHMLNTILHKGRRQRKCDSSLEEKIQRYTAYMYILTKRHQKFRTFRNWRKKPWDWEPELGISGGSGS